MMSEGLHHEISQMMVCPSLSLSHTHTHTLTHTPTNKQHTQTHTHTHTQTQTHTHTHPHTPTHMCTLSFPRSLHLPQLSHFLTLRSEERRGEKASSSLRSA